MDVRLICNCDSKDPNFRAQLEIEVLLIIEQKAWQALFTWKMRLNLAAGIAMSDRIQRGSFVRYSKLFLFQKTVFCYWTVRVVRKEISIMYGGRLVSITQKLSAIMRYNAEIIDENSFVVTNLFCHLQAVSSADLQLLELFCCIQCKSCDQNIYSFFIVTICVSKFSSICWNARPWKVPSMPSVSFAASTIRLSPIDSGWDHVFHFHKWWHLLTLNTCKLVSIGTITK